MEINNFVNMDFLTGFAGTIVGVELIVYCTKELPIIKKIPTRIYIFLLAVIHLLIVKYVTGNFTLTLGNVYLLIINSLLISTILCGGYDVAIGNIQIPQITSGQKKNISIDIEPSIDNEQKQNTDSTTTLENTVTTQTNTTADTATPTAMTEEENTSLSNRGRNSNINDKTN